jgi:hypothetical protein
VTNEVTGDEPENEEPESEEPESSEKYEERSVDRLIFFSDAVTAIAITLLALDLPAPNGATVSAFWASFRQNDGLYLAFLVSFVTIAASWSDHHDAFKHIKRGDPRLRYLNMIWLLMIILVPFATKLLTGNGQDDLTVHAFRWGFLRAGAGTDLGRVVRDGAAHGLASPGRLRKRGQGPQRLGLADLRAHARLRAVDPGLLRHYLRVGALDRRAGAGDPATPAVAPTRGGAGLVTRPERESSSVGWPWNHAYVQSGGSGACDLDLNLGDADGRADRRPARPQRQAGGDVRRRRA